VVPLVSRSSLLLGLLAALSPMAHAVPSPDPLPPVIDWPGPTVAPAAHTPQTPIERSGFRISPDYATTIDYLRSLEQRSPAITLHRFGTSTQGRPLYYARVSTRQGGAARPVVLLQGGIHAGEIDGKDAGTLLLRDIAAGDHAALLEAVDIVFVPVLNPDAHENASANGRPIQRGPAIKGARTNSQGLDLNRDYARLESPEIAAVVKLLQQFDPALYVDVHVSDGTDYQYDVTYAFAGWGTYARSQQTAAWLMGPYSRDLDAALTAAGHVPGVYPSWINEDVPSQGLRISIESPRYSTGYGDFIGVPTVLVENHTFKPYRQRVLGTYALFLQSLRSVARDAAKISEAKNADRGEQVETLAVAWERDPVPLEWRPFKGFRYDTYVSAASGARELKWTGEPQVQDLPVYGTRTTQYGTVPSAWWIPAGNTRVVELLKAHGVQMETLAAPRTVQVEQAQLRNGSERKVSARTPARVQLPAGSVRVPSRQPLGRLAAALLLPESPDSVLAMGWFDRAQPAESPLSRHLLAPMADALMASDPEARRAFERALAGDAAFAADPEARLRWWEARTPYFARSQWTYPIYAEQD